MNPIQPSGSIRPSFHARPVASAAVIAASADARQGDETVITADLDQCLRRMASNLVSLASSVKQP
jgi:hypothetical protein